VHGVPALRRVGHKGADLLAPGNTAASFAAALEAGVDMIEFDVLSERPDGSGELFLAHDYGDLGRRRGGALTLDEGLDLFATEAYGAIELDVDLKLGGYEARVLDALAARGLFDRTLVSTMETSSLSAVRAHAPDVRLGWSVPRVRRNPFERKRTYLPALAGVQILRRVMPRRAARALRAGRCDAIMAHWALVSPALARAVRAAGGELYVWTVDDPERIARLAAMGVDGVITNDPRLFVSR
jgi:glycerophosphoryl diester phosphodiesterase